MLRNCLVSSLCSLALAAQDSPAPREPDPAGPRRFSSVPVPDAAPLDLEAATRAAITGLLSLQQGESGDQWPYEGVYREDGGRLPVGYRVGGTAIACLGLLAAPGFRDDPARRQAVERGLAFVLATLDQPRMQLDFVGTYDVRGWGHIYALELFLHLQGAGLVPAAQADAVATKTAWLVQALAASAIPDSGGWNYSRRAGYLSPRNRASTFMTAPALQALFHARAAGYSVPEQVVTQALDALERARAGPGGYAYGAPPTAQADVVEQQLGMMDRTAGSAARAAVCETTLLLAGRGDPSRLRRAVELFFAHWDDLAVRKSRTGTHEPPYGIAPYYFLFGHVYCAQAIEHLDDADLRVSLRARLRAELAKSRDDDGTWNDRHFDRSAGYGTAMALLALHMPTLPRPPAWVPPPAGK